MFSYFYAGAVAVDEVIVAAIIATTIVVISDITYGGVVTVNC
jgi:hypothetical protein